MRLINIAISDERYFGFMLAKSTKLLVISEIHDFSNRGFRAFVNLKPGSQKKEPSTRVSAMGVKLLKLRPLKLKVARKGLSVSLILEHLQRSKKMTMIEFRRGGKDEYFFGLIETMNSKSFTGKFFSTEGKFLKLPDVIRLSSIKQIQWDSPYGKVMKRISARS